jgi:tRNA(fMet)-specific endonuclease VapC
MIFLLDTNAFSDLMRKHAKLEASLALLPSTDKVVICPIVRGEIRYGIEQLTQSRRRQVLEKQATPLFATIPCEPIPETAGDHYASVKLTRQRKGLTLDENDLWIAATAFALSATLVTRDSDFQQIDGLSISDWTVT